MNGDPEHAAGPTSPRVFISYRHESAEHRQRVLELAQRLRRNGVDAWMDLFEANPALGWPRWMDDQLERADFVLAICSETYDHFLSGRGEGGRGLGVRFEGAALYQMLFDNGSLNDKVIPVLLDEAADNLVPKRLRGATRYWYPNQSDALLRHLWRDPEIRAEPLGRKPDFGTSTGQAGDSAAAGRAPPLPEATVRSEGFESELEDVSEPSLGRYVDAVAIFEVRKQERRVQSASAEELPDVLRELWYLTGERFGDEVKLELLNVLYDRAGRTRSERSPAVAAELAAMTEASLPGGHVARVADSQRRVCMSASAIGTCLAYDGALYASDLLIVDSGAVLLWHILRFGALNGDAEIQERAHQAFETALGGAHRNARGVFKDAVSWLAFQRADALAVRDEDMPNMPRQIDRKISELRSNLRKPS